jgi:hypothetical protein
MRVPLSGIGKRRSGIGERRSQRCMRLDRAAGGLARHDLIPDFLCNPITEFALFAANWLQP